MKLLTRLTAALSLAILVANTAFAQTPPAPPAPPTAKATAVKGYTKKLKSGKTVAVKGYTRQAKPTMASKMTAVKGYTKTLKNGKKVTVKPYTRTTPMKPMKKTL